MILGEDGKRLSKRHGAVNVMQFKDDGYLPHTLLNYLVRLGWSNGDQEIFSLDEMFKLFSLGNISKGGSSFSFDKLNWLNQHYLKNNSVDSLAKILEPYYLEAGINLNNGPKLIKILPEFTERCKTLVEIVEQTKFLYLDLIEYDDKAVKKQFKTKAIEPLNAVIKEFEALTDWTEESIQKVIDTLCEKLELKLGKIAQPIRVAVTGSSMSPSIGITLVWLGKNRVIERLKKSLKLIPSN